MRYRQGLAPTEDMEAEWNKKQWRKAMLQKAKDNSNRKGFFRQVTPKNGTQIQASRWSYKRRDLEDPSSSLLGWNLSAVSSPPLKAASLQFKCNKQRSMN